MIGIVNGSAFTARVAIILKAVSDFAIEDVH